MEQVSERDEQALAFRQQGRSFVKIAALLGFESSRGAVMAYRRAALQRSPEEQATLRAEEQRRFDAMAKKVRADSALPKADAAKRLARIERLRAMLA